MADYVARASLALCGGNDGITNGRDGAAMLIWPFLAFAYFAGWDRDIRTIALEENKVM